jgi:hypothetical protein
MNGFVSQKRLFSFRHFLSSVLSAVGSAKVEAWAKEDQSSIPAFFTGFTAPTFLMPGIIP